MTIGFIGLGNMGCAMIGGIISNRVVEASDIIGADASTERVDDNGGTYEQVSKSFSQGLKEKLDAKQFAAVQAGVKNQVGAIKNPAFVLLNKQYDLQKGYSGIDELVYFGTVSKDKFARIFVSFAEENGKPVVTGFQVTPIEPAKQQPAPAKK